MSNVLYSITNTAEFKGGTVTFENGDSFPFSSDHPKYDDILAALVAGADQKTVFALVSPFDSIFLNFTQITDRVSRKGMNLFFDGDPLNNGIASEIIKTMDAEGFQNGTTWPSYVAFLERLMTNPSEESRGHLYQYVKSHGLVITDTGMLVLYKGVHTTDVADVYESSNSGYGLVEDGSGTITEYKNARLPNAVGYVVTIPRGMVDTNRGVYCSTGLHAGTYDYASSFAPVLLTVLVDPRDVVSVPSDHSNAKVRLSRYEVLEVNEGKTYTGVVSTSADLDDDDADDSELSDDEIYARNKTHEFLDIIPTLVANNENLRRYRNKRVTSKGRPYFDAAMKELGIEYV